MLSFSKSSDGMMRFSTDYQTSGSAGEAIESPRGTSPACEASDVGAAANPLTTAKRTPDLRLPTPSIGLADAPFRSIVQRFSPLPSGQLFPWSAVVRLVAQAVAANPRGDGPPAQIAGDSSPRDAAACLWGKHHSHVAFRGHGRP